MSRSIMFYESKMHLSALKKKSILSLNFMSNKKQTSGGGGSSSKRKPRKKGKKTRKDKGSAKKNRKLEAS